MHAGPAPVVSPTPAQVPLTQPPSLSECSVLITLKNNMPYNLEGCCVTRCKFQVLHAILLCLRDFKVRASNMSAMEHEADILPRDGAGTGVPDREAAGVGADMAGVGARTGCSAGAVTGG